VTVSRFTVAFQGEDGAAFSGSVGVALPQAAHVPNKMERKRE